MWRSYRASPAPAKRIGPHPYCSRSFEKSCFAVETGEAGTALVLICLLPPESSTYVPLALMRRQRNRTLVTCAYGVVVSMDVAGSNPGFFNSSDEVHLAIAAASYVVSGSPESSSAGAVTCRVSFQSRITGLERSCSYPSALRLAVLSMNDLALTVGST